MITGCPRASPVLPEDDPFHFLAALPAGQAEQTLHQHEEGSSPFSPSVADRSRAIAADPDAVIVDPTGKGGPRGHAEGMKPGRVKHGPQGLRGKDKGVPGRLQTSPVLSEPLVSEAFRVGRVDDEPPAGPQHAAALPQKAGRIVGVLQDVIEGNLVDDAVGQSRLFEAAGEDGDPARAGQPRSDGVRFDPEHIPSERLHAH